VCREAGFRPNLAQETNDTQTIVGLVSAGYGVSLVPASIATFPHPRVVYRPLSGPNAILEIALARLRDNREPLVDRFQQIGAAVAQGAVTR
jgi:DNA-binding transcriptional LysR family regulator